MRQGTTSALILSSLASNNLQLVLWLLTFKPIKQRAASVSLYFSPKQPLLSIANPQLRGGNAPFPSV